MIETKILKPHQLQERKAHYSRRAGEILLERYAAERSVCWDQTTNEPWLKTISNVDGSWNLQPTFDQTKNKTPPSRSWGYLAFSYPTVVQISELEHFQTPTGVLGLGQTGVVEWHPRTPLRWFASHNTPTTTTFYCDRACETHTLVMDALLEPVLC